MKRRSRAALALTAAVVATTTFVATSRASGVSAYAVYPAPASATGAAEGGEPSVGVNWTTGAIMVRALNDTYRVTLGAGGAATWTDVNTTLTANLDPILFTDSVLGRTWTGGEVAFCDEQSFSDDDVTWTPSVNACAGVDHPTIGAGPFAAGATTAATLWPHAVYYCAHEDVDVCSVSRDGGLTFGVPVPAGTCFAGHGHVKVSADGSAYLPNARCGTPVTGTTPGGAVSRDNGITWTTYAIPGGSASAGFGFDPSVATTPDNTVYETWIGTSGRLMVSHSADHGSTWATPLDLTSAGVPVNALMPAAVAGKNGAVSIAYLGSATPGAANAAGWHGTWDVYVTTTLDGGATWSTTQVTTDPVQRGWICTSGSGCTSNRNLLDFIDAQLTKDGRVVVAFADGCIDLCATSAGTEADSTSKLSTIAVQSDGPLLL